jgi:hypothetical protein
MHVCRLVCLQDASRRGVKNQVTRLRPLPGRVEVDQFFLLGLDGIALEES